MELALNLVWLVLSAGLILLLALGEPARLSAVRRRAAVAIALACLIAFLFPVISITDDLNSRAVVAETAKTKQWVLSAAAFTFVVTGFFALFLAQRTTRAGQLPQSALPSRVPLSFNCSRRPPPANL